MPVQKMLIFALHIYAPIRNAINFIVQAHTAQNMDAITNEKILTAGRNGKKNHTDAWTMLVPMRSVDNHVHA